MPSPSSMPARPEKSTATTATASNTFHVLNSGSGAGGHAGAAGTYARPPQAAAALRSPPVRSIAGYGYPGAVAANAMAPRTPSGDLAPHMLEQLMFLAGWGNRPPIWYQNYGRMPPHGQPLLLAPPARAPCPIRAPPPFVSGAPGASGSSIGGQGAVSVQSSAVVVRRYGPGGSAGRGKAPNAVRLQITAAAATGSTSKKKTPPAGGAAQTLPPVLAMPTAAGAKGKQVAAAVNGRVRKRAPKDKDSSKAAAPKKPRQRAASKQRTAADALQIVEGTEVQGNDLQIVPVPPPINGGRKRKPNAAASPSSGRCNLVARRSSAVAVAPAKKHTILTWLIDAGFLSDGEKVFYVPGGGGGGAEKVVSGAVTRTGVHCSCCDAVVALPVFEAHAGGGGGGGQQAWEKLLLVSGNSLLRCMQEAWEKERIKTFQSQDKLRASLEQEKEKSSQAMRKLLAKQKKGVVERIMSPRMKMMMMAGVKDSSDDACGVCADGGELLCCDSCPSTFHPECLGATKVPEGWWACHYCRCMLCMANDDYGLSTCQQCNLKYHERCRPLLSNAGSDIGAYCSKTCKKLSVQLSEMIGVTNRTEDGFSWALLKIQKDKPAASQDMAAVLESNVKLAVALGVLNECFNPVKDRRTKIDMLHQAVYSLGSEFKRLSYEGFYTMVLEKDGEIISAALLRLHGAKVAEMPFAATLPPYRKQGMMRRLVEAVEQVAASVQVEKLVIPAITALVDTWKRSFSFRPVDPQSREELKRLSLVVITGTTLLQKHVVGAAEAVTPLQPWRECTAYGAAAPLSDEELAFLEMAPPPLCSFTDLVTGNVSLREALRAWNGRRSCGESSAMALQLQLQLPTSYAHHGGGGGCTDIVLHGMQW